MVSLISEIHDDLEKGALRLMTEYRARLFVDAVRLCEDKVEAEDLVSRTFSKAIFNLESYKEDDNLYGWMKTIMVNIHRNDLARPVARGTTPVSSDALEMYAGADNGTDEQILKNSDHDVLRAAIEQLDPEYRKLVSLYYYNELSLKEIASFFQTSTSSVSRKLEIARKIIAAKVGTQLGKKPIAVLLAALLGVGTLFGAWKAAETVWPEIFCPLGEGQSPVVEMNDVGMASVESEVASADEAVMPMNLKSEKQEEVKMNAFARCATAAAMLAASSAVTAVHADNVSSNQALGTAPAVLAAETATGVTRYVNHSGSDETQTGGTSSETAFATVAAAVEASSDGDVILIESSAEPYAVPSNIVVSAGITIKGQSGNPEDVVVCRPATAASKYRVFTLDNSGAVLQDMTVAGGNVDSVSGGGVYFTSAGGTMDHCIVCNCSASTYKQGGGVFIGSGSSALMNRCVISNCTNSGVNGQGGGSALMMNGGTVRNCLFVDNHLTGGAVSGTVHINGGVFESCTIGGNDAIRCAGVCAGGGTVRNCLIGACTTTGSVTPEESVWAGTASYFANCVAEASINGSCSFESSVFTDAKGGNWMPATGSKAIDGVSQAETWMLDAKDLAGNDRIRGEFADVGCLESDPDAFSAAVVADVKEGIAPLNATFTVFVRNAKGAVRCKFDWNGDGVYDLETTDLVVTKAFDAGNFKVRTVVLAGDVEYQVPGSVDLTVGYGTVTIGPDDDLAATLASPLTVSGTEIVLRKGEYAMSAETVVGKAVTIRGMTGNPADVTILRPSTASAGYRLFTLNSAGAMLKDITVTGGDGGSGSGGGVYFTVAGGTMDHCIVCNCSSSTYKQGGGVFIESGSSALMNRCVISNCTNSGVNGQGGGSALMMGGGTVRNCLFVDNHLTGGAVSGTVHIGGGVLESCTVGGNDAIRCAGVCAGGGTVRNCLIGACATTGSVTPEEAVWAGTASYFGNCVAEASINGSCSSEPSVFADAKGGNWMPATGSKAIDGVSQAETWMLDAKDLAGNDRIRGEFADVGCLESDPDAFSAAVVADVKEGIAPLNATFTVSVENAKGAVRCKFDWNGDGVYDLETTDLVVTKAFDAGNFKVRTVVLAGDVEYQVPGSVDLTVGYGTVTIGPDDDLAATLASPLTVSGTEIVLRKGEYAMSAETVVGKAVTIRGMTGNPADVTILRPSTAGAKYRLFTLNNSGAVLRDITIAGGDVTGSGGGVYFTQVGGTMEHCIVSGCSVGAYNQGGGVFIESGLSALMNRCVVSNCTNSAANDTYGGGSALMMGGGTVRNCLFVDNHLTGGAVGGTVRIDGGVLESCTVGGNDAIRCAGVYAKGGTVRNSLIAVCTTTGSETSAEAVWAGTASCFDACMSDETRINGKCDQASADQIFKSVTHGNYKLCQDSAAKDKGVALPWMADSADLAGNPRLRGSGPDLGCYEILGLGLILIVK